MKKNILGVILVFIFLSLSLSFIVFLEFLPPQRKVEKVFEVKRGERLSEISGNLEKAGLVKSGLSFILYTILRGEEGKIKAGRYRLDSSVGIWGIEKKLVLGETEKIKIAIPEGLTIKDTCEKLSQKLERRNPCHFQIDDFKNEFSFLDDAPPGASLEGFLFPDTYYFSGEESDKEIIEKFLKNFGKELNPDIRKEIQNRGKSIFEIITAASIIEKEIYNTDDCKNCKELVSGILWKRLKSGMPLQVDATLNYILGAKNLSFDQMRKEIGRIKNSNSPYNTYKYLGLPPGPICNPGIKSIRAAVYPEKSDNWYYLSSPDGKTFFSKTLSEHNFKKAKYLP